MSSADIRRREEFSRYGPPVPKRSTPRPRVSDADYKKALGLDPKAPLPARLGATGAAGSAAAQDSGEPAKPKHPRRKPAKAAKVAKAGTPRSGGTKAQVPGNCPFCKTHFEIGAPISKLDGGWGHTACRDEQRVRGQILSGQTFRARQSSGWKLGGSPSSSRSSRF